MSEINIFGWKLESAAIGSSPYKYKNYTLVAGPSIDGRREFMLNIGPQFSLFFRAKPPFTYLDVDRFRLSDQHTTKELAGKGIPFIVEIAGLKLNSSDAIGSANDGGATGFLLNGSFGQDFDLYPIGLTVDGLAGLDLSDPDRPYLYFSAGSFLLTTRSSPLGRPLFRRSYSCRAKRVYLLDPASSTQFEIDFEIGANKPLPLYADRVADGTYATAMHVDACRLHVAMARKQGIENQISRIWLEPSDDGLRLTTYAITDAANEPGTWRLRGRYVDLNCCLRDAPRPSTLILAPLYPATAGSLLDNNVTATQEGKKPVHGLVENGEFYIAGVTGSLVCELEETCKQAAEKGKNWNRNDAAVARTVVSDLTFPWFRFASQKDLAPQFRYTKPGVVYSPEDGGHSIETLRFEGPELAFPILPLEWMSSSSKECQTNLVQVLNEEVKHEAYQPTATVHETYFHEAPLDAHQQTRLTGLFYQDPVSGTLKSRPQISPFPSEIDFGLAKLRAELGGDPGAPEDPRKYVVIRRSDVLSQSTAFARCLGDFTIVESSGPREDVVGILKLSRELTLQDILDEEKKSQNKGQIPDLNEVLHPSLRDRAWTGIIFFKLSVNCQDAASTPVLKDIIPTTGIPLKYIAITPVKQNAQRRFSVCARVKWENQTPSAKPWTGIPQNEVRCMLKSLDVAWFDSSLTSFHSTTELRFEGLFGQREGAKELSIEGNYDQASRTVRFTGAFDQPVQIIGRAGIKPFGPIQSVDVNAATIESVDGKTSFSLDGSILLGKWGGTSVFAETGKPLEYKNLRIIFDHVLDAAGSWLNISYPSFRFPVAIPVLKFLSFDLNLESLAVDWNKNDNPWNGFLSFQPGTLTFPSVRFGFKVDLMKLPLLAWKNIDKLTLQILLGFERANFRIGIGFAGFDTGNEKLTLDLLRFLKLTIEKVKQKEAGKIKALLLHKISLEIADHSIISDLEVVIFSDDQGRHGFLAYKPTGNTTKPNDNEKANEAKSKNGEKKDASPAFLKIHWILIAQNLKLPTDLLHKLMELPAIDPGSQPSADTCALLKTDESFQNGIAKLSDEIIPELDKTALTTLDQWMFGAGFRVLNILEGKFLFQDGYYYGIALNSPAFCHWFGFDLFISVVYVKGAQPSDDQFTIAFRAPRVTLPAFAFTGGMISLMIGVNGSFLVDIGFPWIQNGVRRWDRALGAIITPFQGSGGFYLRRQTLSNYSEEGQTRSGMVIGAGLALQFGLGGAYGSEVFRVTASIGIFAVVEGDALLLDNNLDGLVLIGSVGLLGRASGELHWWIISIRVEVMLVAEARLKFVWGCDPRLALVGSSCDKKPATLSFQMTVYASVSASACIGWGPFQVCAGITVSVAIPVTPEIKFKLEG